uniref:VanZ family protein n=1 Tax=Enterococcus faecium TaxID=1352 RepID=UPI0018EF1CC3
KSTQGWVSAASDGDKRQVYGGKIAFYFSAIIEFLQLFLRLGTFQISDFVYNTLGGILGVILYKLILITKRDGER